MNANILLCHFLSLKEHVYEDPDAQRDPNTRRGVPPPTYTFALRDGARYPPIPSELGREIQGN